MSSECADRVAVSDAKGFSRGGKNGIVSRATDGDIDRACIDGVGVEALQVSDDPIARRALGGMDGPRPFRPEMPFLKLSQISISEQQLCISYGVKQRSHTSVIADLPCGPDES